MPAFIIKAVVASSVGGPAMLHIPSRDVFAVLVCVPAGSRYEPAEASGLAHLLKHGVFLGAGGRDYRSIRATIDRLGGDVSAETSEEIILYWGSVNDRRDFAECLDLLADLVLAPGFEEEAVQREIGTVIQEISGAGDDIFQVVLESTKKLLWPGHPLGRPVGGTQETLRRLSGEDCRRYWRETHRPERMVIAVVGSSNESKQARQRFNARLVTTLAPGVDDAAAVRPRGVDRTFRPIPMAGKFARLCFGLPAVGWRDAGLPALELLNDVLGRDETSHLWEAVRGQGLSYATESFVDCFSETGWLGIVTDAPVDSTAEVVHLVRQEVASLAERLSCEEFEQARKSHVARLRNEEQNSPLEWAKYQVVHAYFRGRVPSIEDMVRELREVTFEEAHELARRIFRPERLKMSVGGPRRSLEQAKAAFRA